MTSNTFCHILLTVKTPMNKKSKPPIPDGRLELLFRHAGLSEKQAKLYRLLLIDGEARPSALSKKSGVKRGNVYALLKDLSFRGLVTEVEKEKVTYFRPEPPEKLGSLIEYQEKEAQVAKNLAAELLPSLTSQWKTTIGKPVIRYYEGEEGLKKILEDVYAPGKKEILGAVGLEHPHPELYAHITDNLLPLRIRRKIFARALNTDTERARAMQERNTKELRETFLIDPANYPLPAEIDVYEDKIALSSFIKDDVGLIIENHAIATTLMSVFKLLFDCLRRESAAHPKMVQQKD